MANKLVIRQNTPARARWMLAIAAVLAFLALWGLFESGRKAGGFDRFDAARQRADLRAEIATLEEQNETLERELAIARTADKIEQEAYGQVSEELGDLQSQIAELNKELAFYRGIMAPADGNSGLQIQAVQLFENGGDRDFQLKLVLIQAGPQDRRVKGSVEVALLAGNNGEGEARRLDLQEVAEDSADLLYSFRYFQVLERDLTLPDDFQPVEIEVNLKPSSKDDAIVAAFPWRLAGS